MTAQGLLQIAVYILVLVALVKPLGAYMAAVYEGKRTFLSPLIAPLERGIYRLSGVEPTQESGWKRKSTRQGHYERRRIRHRLDQQHDNPGKSIRSARLPGGGMRDPPGGQPQTQHHQGFVSRGTERLQGSL